MIYAKSPKAKEKDFLKLLEKSKSFIINFLGSKRNISPTYFEKVVFIQMCRAARKTIFNGAIRQTGTHDFPDIIANGYFGVEVKMTENDHWTSTGNSVLESSRIKTVERIYVMFGKFGGKLDIKYRLYQECLSEISVTHSPRYRINMKLPTGNSIFDKIGVDYDILRKDTNPIQKIKDYYRSQLKEGEELWWLDQNGDDNAVSPIIKPFRSLSEKEKENFIVESMILFPEMFGNSNAKFERAAAYLIAEYNVVSANLRDKFTAGGKVVLRVGRRSMMVPQVFDRMRIRAKAIRGKIEDIDEQTLLYYWRVKKIEKDRLGQWKKLLKKNKLGGIAVKVFDSGLL